LRADATWERSSAGSPPHRPSVRQRRGHCAHVAIYFSPNICSSLPLPMAMRLAWQQCDLRRRCGSKKLSAEATNSRKKKAPAVGAGGRARPGPKFAERIVHRPLFALHVGEMLEEERAISLSHIIGPIPLSRSDPLPGICSMTPEICSKRPSRRGVLSSTSGHLPPADWPPTALL
jgi:hypothetical protein